MPGPANVQDLSRALEGGAEVVCDHDDGHALPAVQIAEGLVQVLGGGGVQARDGFVQNQQPPCGAEGPGQKDPLLLPAGEVPVALVLQLQNAQLSQVHQGLGLLGGGVEKAEAFAVQAPGENDLQDGGGEVLLGPGLLGEVANRAALQLRRTADLPGLGP